MRRLIAGLSALFLTSAIWFWLSSDIALAGNLFEADFGSGSIYEFTPSGTRSLFASGLDGPIDLAFGSGGNLFVADYYSDNIYEFTPSGTRSTFNSSGYGPCGLAFAPTPEPSTFALLGASALGLLGYAWRRRRRKVYWIGCPEVANRQSVVIERKALKWER